MRTAAMSYFPAALLGVLLSAAAANAAETPAPTAASRDASLGEVGKLLPELLGVAPDDLRASPAPGLLQVNLGGSIGYVTADGKYLLKGDLFEIASRANLTEAQRRQDRLTALAGVDETQAIVFAPAGAPKHTIVVFTDVDCGFCRKLHGEIAELNRLGVRVRYLAYPRSGPNTPSWSKSESVWCAQDRNAMLTEAKLGKEVPVAHCGTKAVANEYELGRRLGVRGTPAIITQTGELIDGYMPAARLSLYLDMQAQSQSVAAR